MELMLFSFCSFSLSYQRTSVGGWKLISGATGGERVKKRWTGHACSVWNNVSLWWKYCLWALDEHKVVLGSSEKFKLDCKILKLHPKDEASELFNGKFRCSHCLPARHRLRHTAPSPLCPGMCRREAWMQKGAALCSHVKQSKSDLGVCPKVSLNLPPTPCWTKYCWAELGLPFLHANN